MFMIHIPLIPHVYWNYDPPESAPKSECGFGCSAGDCELIHHLEPFKLSKSKWTTTIYGLLSRMDSCRIATFNCQRIQLQYLQYSWHLNILEPAFQEAHKFIFQGLYHIKSYLCKTFRIPGCNKNPGRLGSPQAFGAHGQHDERVDGIDVQHQKQHAEEPR